MHTDTLHNDHSRNTLPLYCRLGLKNRQAVASVTPRLGIYPLRLPLSILGLSVIVVWPVPEAGGGLFPSFPAGISQSKP